MVLRAEDEHFLIDNVSPSELGFSLRVLAAGDALTTEELRVTLRDQCNYVAQRNLTFTTRRLIDLGAAEMTRQSGKPVYSLTARGFSLRELMESEPLISKDVMHYLHYDGYNGSASSRKLFWSYYQCCDIVWNLKRMPPDETVVAEVQSRIAGQFPALYERKTGGFNKGGVNAGWRPWVMQLEPSPFPDTSKVLMGRMVTRYELVLLALDRVYRQRGYHYGDPVLLDDMLLDEVAAVFFLDLACCRELMERAARLDRTLSLRSTFAGTSLTLQEPYTIERL